MRRRFRIIVIISLLICLPVLSSDAANILSVHIEKDEWSWSGNTAATFEGDIVCQGVTEDDPVTLRLTVACSPESANPGKVVFTSVQDKKLTVRKQKNEYVLDSSPTATTHFTGSWIIPEDEQYGEVSIHLEVIASDGTVAAEDEIRMTNEAHYLNENIRRIPDPGSLLRILLIASGIVWVLAAIRLIYNRHRR